jgi:endonuclease YncB( thermonuclease family)
MWDRRAKVVSVHDGDTLTVDLDQGFYDTKRITVRLQGVFAPELHQLGGPETLAFVQSWMTDHASPDGKVIVTTVRLKNDKAEKTTLSRYVAEVTSLDGIHHLNADVVVYVAAHNYPKGRGAEK